MKRVAAISAVVALVSLGAPSPANALPEVCTLGVVCVTAEGEILDEAGNVIGRTLDSLPAPVTITPAPITEYVPGPARTSTVTRTQAPQTVTAAPTTVTSTTTVTASPTNTTARQNRNESGTLSPSTPNVPVPGPVEAGVDLIPDDPETAAATGSLFGLFAGIVLGIVGLFIAYRRGQIDGEKATLKEFLGVIRGEPTGPRHRA